MNARLMTGKKIRYEDPKINNYELRLAYEVASLIVYYGMELEAANLYIKQRNSIYPHIDFVKLCAEFVRALLFFNYVLEYVNGESLNRFFKLD